ncbi:MAG: hypothetical protein CO108_29850 [Deltaproteobacteria bacterium CG_4_9_14_3_um_filter_63_12]|nr:MAG: hypothetical protein CO108_29850 [Deltaproteobacteria bacterium CG_4_9_14_3_um_filter_63_12]
MMTSSLSSSEHGAVLPLEALHLVLALEIAAQLNCCGWLNGLLIETGSQGLRAGSAQRPSEGTIAFPKPITVAKLPNNEDSRAPR